MCIILNTIGPPVISVPLLDQIFRMFLIIRMRDKKKESTALALMQHIIRKVTSNYTYQINVKK